MRSVPFGSVSNSLCWFHTRSKKDETLRVLYFHGVFMPSLCVRVPVSNAVNHMGVFEIKLSCAVLESEKRATA